MDSSQMFHTFHLAVKWTCQQTGLHRLAIFVLHRLAGRARCGRFQECHPFYIAMNSTRQYLSIPAGERRHLLKVRVCSRWRQVQISLRIHISHLTLGDRVTQVTGLCFPADCSRAAAQRHAEAAREAAGRKPFRPPSPQKRATSAQGGEFFGTISGYYTYIPVCSLLPKTQHARFWPVPPVNFAALSGSCPLQ